MVAQIEVSDGLYTLELCWRYSCPKGAKSILYYPTVRININNSYKNFIR